MSVQSLSRVWLFATPWTAACQASLSITNSWSLPKPMSIESVMPSNHLILCRPFSSCPQSFPASGSFPMSQLFASSGQNIGLASALVLLKSKDITLPTKVHLVQAMVFPVVMYGCESWTIKKAEGQRIDAFELWCWRRLLRVPWTARRSNHPS